MNGRSSPRTLAVPEESKIHEGDHMIFCRILDILEGELSCSICPFGAEIVLVEERMIICVLIKAKDQSSDSAVCDRMSSYFRAKAQTPSTTW